MAIWFGVEGGPQLAPGEKPVRGTETHHLINHGRVLQHLIHLLLDFGAVHHALQEVGVVRVDAHVGKRVEAVAVASPTSLLISTGSDPAAEKESGKKRTLQELRRTGRS